MPLPSGFTSIKDTTNLTSGGLVSLLGVVVGVTEPQQTRGSDWVMNFTIQDDFTSGTVGAFSGSSINCRLFRPSLTAFPKISGVGDIVILRKFKLNAWHGRLDCVNDRRHSGVLVFDTNKIPVPELSQAFQLGNQRLPHDAMFGTLDFSTQEQMAVIHLKHAASGTFPPKMKQLAATKPFKAATPRKLALVKDLAFNLFYDLRAQVVNIYYSDHATVELKVTDYTPHQDLFLYADPDQEESYLVTHKNWQGPYGQLTLDVRLYGSNASWARDNVRNGDFVFLKNMRTKISPNNKLEGVLHEDRVTAGQVDIRKLINSKDIMEIKSRREDYEKQQTHKSALETLRDVPIKPSAKASVDKKALKKERLRLQKELEQKELEKAYEEREAARNITNINVKAQDPDVHLSTISEILYDPALQAQTPSKNTKFTLPFLNCKHRSRVRVVDFFPPKLELFTHNTTDSSWNPAAKKQTLAKDRWEWGFVLLLEDAKVPPNTTSDKLRVMVGNEAGQCLTKTGAVDLRNDPKALKRLEETMFILWGNLLELKTELQDRGSDLPLPPGDNRLQNKPFDCCIEEYGAEVIATEGNPTGFDRVHRLFGTTINT